MHPSRHSLIASLLCLSLSTTAFCVTHLSAADDQVRSNTGHEVDEGGITMKVMGKYTVDSDIGPFKLQVYTKGSTVMLVGELTSEDQFSKAIMLAASVEDVTNVDVSKLTVKDAKGSLNDIYLDAMIKGNMLKNKVFENESTSAWPVSFVVKDKKVQITGKVTSKDEKERIVTLVKAVEGVGSVDDKIEVVP